MNHFRPEECSGKTSKIHESVTAMAKLLDVRSDQTLDTPSDTSGSQSSASVNPNDSTQPVSFQAAV